MNQPNNWFYVYILPLTPAALTIAGWAFLSRREKTKRISERKSKRIETAAGRPYGKNHRRSRSLLSFPSRRQRSRSTGNPV